MTLLLLAAACRRDPVPPGDDAPPSTTGETAPTGDTAPTGPVGPPLAFDGPPPRNLLMISIDTTRRDLFGDYAAARYTDFLADRMAEAVVLDDHQQCSDWTLASTSCTLNGRYHEDNGFIPQLRSDNQPFPDGQNTLAARLQAEGYHTILLSPNSWLGPQWNNAQGYDETNGPGSGRAGEILTVGRQRVQAALADGADRWMLHVHLMEPHAPYVPPEAYRDELVGLDPLPDGWDLDRDTGHYAVVNTWPTMTPELQALLLAHLQGRYHGELRFLDDQVAEQWPLLDEAGLLDDTLVVVWTDHGEQFFERGKESHAWFLNAEENDAVLFFWAKNLAPRRWAAPTHAVDLLPTVLDALGFPTDDPTLSGHVLGAAPPHRPRFAMSVARGGVLQSVTVDDRKLVFDHDDGRVTAFDRATDRAELTDRFDPADPTDQALWGLLLPRIERMRALQPDEGILWPSDLPRP